MCNLERTNAENVVDDNGWLKLVRRRGRKWKRRRRKRKRGEEKERS